MQDKDNPGGELDLAVDERRRCKKNSSSVLSYIQQMKRAKEAETVAAKS